MRERERETWRGARRLRRSYKVTAPVLTRAFNVEPYAIISNVVLTKEVDEFVYLTLGIATLRN